MVIMRFETDHVEAVTNRLSAYVVATRGHPGCRNVDFVVSAIVDGRLVIVQKWESVENQQSHFDSDDMVSMASDVSELLRTAPDIDLYDGLSMHDLN